MPQDNSDLLPLFAAAGQQYGIDPTLLMAVAKQESGVNPNTPDSYQGAQGLMQLLPSTARSLGVTDTRDPRQAIPAAAAYLRQGFDATGTPQGAIAYYHGGPDTRQWGPKTRAYVPAVASHYSDMKKQEPDPYADIADEALKALSPPAAAMPNAATAGFDPHEAIANEALSALQALGQQKAADGTAQPGTLDQARAAIPANAVGQIEILASSRQLPDAIANKSISNIANATGADPTALRSYYYAFKARPVSGDEAFAQGTKQGVTLGTAPAIGGAFDALSGERPYAQGMASRAANLKAAEAQHPYATLGGEVAGTIAGLAPIGATAIGGRALGITGNSLIGRAAASAGTNALVGGTDAAIRSGGDWNQTAQGAGLGGLVGFVAPGAGQAIGVGVNKLTGMIGSPFTGARAANALIDTLDASGRSISDLSADLSRNPRLALMDADPGLQQMAAGLASKPGPARATLAQAYQDRVGSARGAVAGAYDEALGGTPDVKALLDGLKATAKANADKGFGEALQGAKPVDVSGVIKAIDDKVRPGIGQIVSPGTDIARGPVEDALMRVRAQLTDGKNTLTDANALHGIQQNLRTTAETLANSANGQDRLTAGALRDTRGTLNDAIDAATGGKFKPAQKQFADDISMQDAFHKGLDIFRNRAGAAGLEDRPEYWRAAIADMSPDEQAALKQGARVAVDQRIGDIRSAARNGAAITSSEPNLDKLSAIVGEKEAGQLAQRMADEQRIAKTNSMLFEGSQTEPRRQGAMATIVREAKTLPLEVGIPGVALAHGSPATAAGLTALAAARRSYQFLAQRSDLARNNLLADYLSASGPSVSPVIDALNARLVAQGGFGRLAGSTGNLLIDASRQFSNAPPPIETRSHGGPPR